MMINNAYLQKLRENTCIRLLVAVSKMSQTFEMTITLYPIHSDTECLDTASGSANKQGDGENVCI